MHHPITGHKEYVASLTTGPHKSIWLTSLANEFAHCAQGLTKTRPQNSKIIGNNTIFFITPSPVPPGRRVTYNSFVCAHRPTKTEPFCVRLVVGGDKLSTHLDICSPAISVVDTKLHLNSTIPDASRGARYATADIKDFFLQSPMRQFQYMRVHKRYIPPEIRTEYTLMDTHYNSNNYIYLEIRKGTYGLKEAAILAYNQLCLHLLPYGYTPVRHTPGYGDMSAPLPLLLLPLTILE